MDSLELICFQIIASAGEAKSCYMEALEIAKEGKFEDAKMRIEEGEKAFLQCHGVHARLIQEEAQGNSTPNSLLLIHAEDQMMGAESCLLLVTEIIALYKKIG